MQERDRVLLRIEKLAKESLWFLAFILLKYTFHSFSLEGWFDKYSPAITVVAEKYAI